MLTRWLTLTALLAGSASPARAAFTVAPACRVKSHPEGELTLNCGDKKDAGVVQYWHTPFGDLHAPGFHSNLDPVFMHRDGSLVVPNTSATHSGLYYCLLQHTERTTLWPYQLHVGHDNQNNQDHISCGAFRFRRNVGSDAERQEGVSDGQFAAAVAASVLLTFVFGFSAGALSRTLVLRCLGAVASKLRSPRKRRGRTNTPDRGSDVTMATPPPMSDNQAFEMEQVELSSTASSPPAKPKRSFREKCREEPETTAYLEGCDYKEEKKEEEEEEEAGGTLEERSKGGEEDRGVYLLAEDGGSQTNTEEEENSEEEKSREEKEEGKQEKEVEEGGEQEERRKEEGEGLMGSEEEKGGDEKTQKEGEGRRGSEAEEGETTRTEDDGETGSDKQEGTGDPRPRRRSRVIRLYQYDDDGQRYCHLPSPAPEEPRPAPRLKQRSVSLTRLNAIMAAASAGPLDAKETGTEERPHFHMDI